MKRIVLIALACLLLLSSCAVEVPPDEGEVISAAVTEYIEPETTAPPPETTAADETTAPETEETLPLETEPEPEETRLEDVMHLLPARHILETSERLAEVYNSYTRRSVTVTEIVKDGDRTRSEISSELLINSGNASFRRTSESGNEEYFLIDGFLCYGGKFGNYRFGGYDIASFSELAGNYFSIDAFDGGTVLSQDGAITLKFDTLTEKGRAEITEMLTLPEGYEVVITNAEFVFVTDLAANMKEKVLSLSATLRFDGEEALSFTLTSRTEQTGINEENDIVLPAMTSYVLVADASALALYESALGDLYGFFGNYQAFELSETDEMLISGAVNQRYSEKIDYAYAKKIGASVERTFTIGTSKSTRVLTHFNHRRGFSQINGGSIFVDSTINAQNLEKTLTEPLGSALLPFSTFGRIEIAADGSLVVTLGTEGKIALAREILLAAGISASSVSVTSCDEAKLTVSFDSEDKVTSIVYSLSAHVTADGKSYTLTRTHTLKITKRGSAQVKVIYIDVDEEEE